MNMKTRLAPAVRIGLLGGIVTLLISLIGIVEASHGRAVIYPMLSLGQTLLLLTYAVLTSTAVRQSIAAAQEKLPPAWTVASGAVAGLLISVFLAVLVVVGRAVDMRPVLIRASPTLFNLLTFGQQGPVGIVALLAFGLVLGALIGLLFLLPARLRQAIVLGLGLIPLIAVLASAFFAARGLSSTTALIVLVAGGIVGYLWTDVRSQFRRRVDALPPAGKRTYRLSVWIIAAIIVLLLPRSGSYPAQVLDMVGQYVLMGLGLNIVVGFAGLLDLGYVAFYALGAYMVGVLTSPEIGWLGGVHLGFWGALPFAVLIGLLAGVILGVPVLGMRGDYLAIVTLGFGEIIRIVALSDWLKPYIGGSNGITRIPRPTLGPINFNQPDTLYYIILVGCILTAFVAIRLKDSRLGRAWMAMREDEDVAQAMGIDLVRTKLLAFATGAAFSALAGSFFATLIGSIYPHSFTLLISINVLAVIIVGGMGSIPGAVVGAVALVGLPELLREFSEYRLWVFGAALVYMMLTRPEGLVPEARRKLELHEAESLDVEAATATRLPPGQPEASTVGSAGDAVGVPGD